MTRHLVACIVILPSFLGFTPLQADIIPGVSGFVRATNNANTIFVTGNYAVYDRLTGVSAAGDRFGTGLANFDTSGILGSGSAAFDTNARYLYLYQDVVAGGSANVVGASYGIGDNRFASVTSFAQWNRFLADDNGIVSLSNDFGPSSAVPYLPMGFANVNVVSPSVQSNAAAVNLISLTLSSNPFPPSTDFGYSSTITAGNLTNIYGFTSNMSPILHMYSASFSFSGGQYPIPTPEPLAIGLIATVIGFVVRKKGKRS